MNLSFLKQNHMIPEMSSPRFDILGSTIFMKMGRHTLLQKKHMTPMMSSRRFCIDLI